MPATTSRPFLQFTIGPDSSSDADWNADKEHKPPVHHCQEVPRISPSIHKDGGAVGKEDSPTAWIMRKMTTSARGEDQQDGCCCEDGEAKVIEAHPAKGVR